MEKLGEFRSPALAGDESLGELRSQTLADGVEDALLSYISRKQLILGESLPGEDELAQRLQVSRHIVREGLSRLKSLGLIESRRRRGMVIARPNAFAGLQKLAGANLFSLAETHEFMELRVALELGMVDFIFVRKSASDIEALRALAGPRQSFQEIDLEVDFHNRLFAITRNSMASQFRNILRSAFAPFAQRRRQPDTETRTPTHQELCDALEQGSAEAFRELLREHFRPYLQMSSSLSSS